MRRKEREVTDIAEIERIVRSGTVLYLGLCDEGSPYVVPLNYGYDRGIFYMHCAREGRKLDILRANDRASAVVVPEHSLVRGTNACSFSMNYRSVMVSGRVREVADPDEKRRGMEAIMRTVAGADVPVDFGPSGLDRVVILALEADRMTGKQHL
jgi:nitroimidazol reductase NimA-like FMN-containing flavoprotein (pyridoxamine 5'-phosphate oxidase superfamily)